MAVERAAFRANRWAQLWLGVLCMVLIANLQYAWTLFVNPLHQAHGWTIAEIQIAFSIFIATETWLTPAEGWIVDHLGPRRGPPLMVAFGGLLVGIGWIINAYAGSLAVLYLGSALAGVGAGAIYATCVGNAVKWFPDRRGLAVGLTAGGYAIYDSNLHLVAQTANSPNAFQTATADSWVTATRSRRWSGRLGGRLRRWWSGRLNRRRHALPRAPPTSSAP